MRNALILLAVVALILLAVGALNNGTAFEIDYVAGTVSQVSLFWVSLVVAAVVFVAGMAAVWFALAGAARGRRKLEAELQATYERLRGAEREAADARSVTAAAEARAAAAEAPELALVEETAIAGREEPTVVAAEAPTAVSAEAPTAVAAEDETAVLAEAETAVAPEGETVASDAAASAGEQTAVTMAPPAREAERPANDGAPASDDGHGEDAGDARS